MAISNCLFSPTSENPHGFSIWCILAKFNAKPLCIAKTIVSYFIQLYPNIDNMKCTLWICISIFFLTSCKQSVNNVQDYETYHMELHKEMDKVSDEYGKFEKDLIMLYKLSESQPKNVLAKIDSLIEIAKNEKDPIKSQISYNIITSLFYFKAEILYKSGEYQKSINNIHKSNYRYKLIHTRNATALAANYIKLGEKKLAKSMVDSIGKGYYIYDYALGNYYESIGNRDSALIVYNQIKADKEIKHYAYYKSTLARIEYIEKNNHLLNEIYFPTGNPSFEICDSDDENRSKIFKLMETLPENQKWAGTSIVESPQINDKNYYWVKVQTQENKEFNYYIYLNTFEIKFFDPKRNKLMTLEEWRKERKNGI